MSTVAVGRAENLAARRTTVLDTPGALIVWLVPLLYPFSLEAISYSAALLRAQATGAVPLAGVLLIGSIAWAVAGPFIGWVTLNYLDKNKLDRAQCRMVVHGALAAAATPSLYTALRQISSATLPLWYVTVALVAMAALLPVPTAFSTPKFRRIHGYSAMLIALFALAHISNHSLGIISLPTHAAVLHVLRLVYRQQVMETVVVLAVLVQSSTGLVMVWKSYLRSGTPVRNMQILSGLFLALFFFSHLSAVYHTRQRGIDTDFAWAVSGQAGLLGVKGSAALVPLYTLSVLMIFTHLASQMRRRLPRVVSERVAQNAFYGVLALGGVATLVIGAAACGVHLMH